MDTTTDHFTPLTLRVRGNYVSNKHIIDKGKQIFIYLFIYLFIYFDQTFLAYKNVEVRICPVKEEE